MILENSLSTIDDVRARLRRFMYVQSIQKPLRESQGLCYIAQALDVRVSNTAITTARNDKARAIARALWGRDWARHIHRPAFTETWEVDLTPMLRLFVRAFDAGMYPQLE